MACLFIGGVLKGLFIALFLLAYLLVACIGRSFDCDAVGIL